MSKRTVIFSVAPNVVGLEMGPWPDLAEVEIDEELLSQMLECHEFVTAARERREVILSADTIKTRFGVHSHEGDTGWMVQDGHVFTPWDRSILFPAEIEGGNVSVDATGGVGLEIRQLGLSAPKILIDLGNIKDLQLRFDQTQNQNSKPKMVM
jgi:hypothetical protein